MNCWIRTDIVHYLKIVSRRFTCWFVKSKKYIFLQVDEFFFLEQWAYVLLHAIITSFFLCRIMKRVKVLSGDA